ncbi:MAG: ABC transporter ATP-binding protein/permease [Clostridia bacterium]|nr:ABC transporter ATP-binding protein/permease [Clostridia bacterium]
MSKSRDDRREQKPKQKLSSVFRNNLYMLGRIARYTPAYFVLLLVEALIMGALDSAAALFNFNLLNAVDEGTDFGYAVRIIALMAAFYLAAFAFQRWYHFIRLPLMRQKLHLRMHEELFIKARSMDLACFDDPAFYNDFVWAMNESDTRAVEVLEDTGALITRVAASVTMFSLLFTIDPVIAIILFASTVVTIVCNLIGNKVSFLHEKENNPRWRKRSYINRVYHLSDYSKELRIRHADELLMAEYDRNTEEIIRTDRKFGIRYFFLYGLAWGMVGQIVSYGLTLYMILLLTKGEIEVGGFAATISVVWSIRWMLTDLVERLTKYRKHSLYIEKYLEFLRFEPRVTGSVTDVPPFESLELRDVSFSYVFADHPQYAFHEADYEPPAQESGGKDALRHVSLTIRKGDKIAIVGYNGAGKTTLIKLLMRMYDPTDGVILYNGTDIRTFDPEAYRARIGTVFQDYKIFAASIAENVMNGPYTDADEQRVLDALVAADFTDKLDTLEEGIQTHLTREFNEKGVNLSGGEAQKIAISRVFARDYPIVIMDEPSSALDPLAEYNLNRSILQNTGGRTVIFISHRLSTTRIADTIYMFDTGRLIEQGSHDELLVRDGKYAEMFRLQAEKYRESVEEDV